MGANCSKCFEKKKIIGLGLCSPCYHMQYRRKKMGIDVNTPRLVGKRNSGHICKKDGYKLVYKPLNENSNKNGIIREHRYIMQQYIGRPLRPSETVHHVNGIRTDNRIENLELWDSSHPPGQRVEDKIQWCIEFLKVHGIQTLLLAIPST